MSIIKDIFNYIVNHSAYINYHIYNNNIYTKRL